MQHLREPEADMVCVRSSRFVHEVQEAKVTDLSLFLDVV